MSTLPQSVTELPLWYKVTVPPPHYAWSWAQEPSFVMGSVMEATLIFPHQLYRPHPAVRAGSRIWLLEDPLFFGNDRHWPLRFHVQKLLLHRRSLAAFRLELERAGHEAIHIACSSDATTTEELLDQFLPPGLTSLHVVDPVDDILLRRLQRWTQRKNVHLRLHPSPNFLTAEDDVVAHFSGTRKPFMGRFYAEQRQRMRILTREDGTPVGDRWSFDTENRKKLSASVEVPVPPFLRFSDIAPTTADEKETLPPNCGTPGTLLYPYTRNDAQTWFDTFLEWRLHHFGAYEDAISQNHPVVFHSVLTPALNIGLLDPGRVVSRALAAAERQHVPLASIEGF
ncbi:MAG TPA: cryptochrome/photolyase family protein, partial [Opitutaceae bacterium]|nr:cryptochrome/photolyase family protein [Opitutaceae bacterium]